MQRKNNLLTLPHHRGGMAMIMAISVVVIIATIMAFSLSLTTQTTKQTSDLYIYEQAILLSQSAAEYALLRVSQDGPCTHTNDLNFSPDIDGDAQSDYYDVNISLLYIYTAPSPCSAAQTYTTVTSDEQNGSLLMDITISVNDLNITNEPIRYFRRSIQKL